MPPRIIIRERHAPPLTARASIEGYLRWQLINRAGRVRREGEQHNLILDQGLDQIATYGLAHASSASASAGFQYFAVGTGNTAPANDQTGLDTEIDRTNNVNTSDVVTRLSDGVYEVVRSFEFDFSEAIGNLAEWGVAPGGTPAASDLYARELFRDTGGSPSPVTKTADDKLRGIYTRRVTLTPTTAVSGSLIIANHGTVDGDYRLIGGAADTTVTGMQDLRAFSALAVAAGALGTSVATGALFVAPASLAALTYDATAASGLATDPTTDAHYGARVHTVSPAYVPGAFARSGAVMACGTANGNYEHFGLGVIGYPGSAFQSIPSRLGFTFAYDPGGEWAKDDLHELRVTMPTVSWARV